MNRKWGRLFLVALAAKKSDTENVIPVVKYTQKQVLDMLNVRIVIIHI